MERYSGHTNEYSRSTLMGNWFEDKLKADIEEKECEKTQGIRNKELLQYQQKLSIALKEIQLSNCSDKSLKYGDIIMLKNMQTNGVLCTDADENEKIWINGTKVLQSTTTSHIKYSNKSFARNSFIITPPPINKQNKNKFNYKIGDILHFGQPFCLQIHTLLSPKKLYYLHSEITSHLNSADFSRDQLVIFHPNKSSSTVWKCMYGDHSLRIEYDTTPINLYENNNVVLEHQNTCSLLASNNIFIGTDFGNEYQTSCNTFNPNKRIQTIKKELIGFNKDSRGELTQNKWQIIDYSILSSNTQSEK
eukprot:391529_1